MGVHPEPLREDQVATFWADGVVHLRGVVPGDWITRLRDAVEDLIAARDGTDLSAMAERIDAGGGAVLRDKTRSAAPRGRFFAGTDHWRRHATFRAFALESPLPALVAVLLRARQSTARSPTGPPDAAPAATPPGEGAGCLDHVAGSR